MSDAQTCEHEWRDAFEADLEDPKRPEFRKVSCRKCGAWGGSSYTETWQVRFR